MLLVANLIYSAFSLLGCFVGVAGLYILLAADFVGILQLFVYVGGITVLIIFAVMFTNHLGDVKITNQSMNWKSGIFLMTFLFLVLYMMITRTPWKTIDNPTHQPTTQLIGDSFLTTYLLPFEFLSVLLLVALIGAIVIARKQEEPKL